MQLRLWLTCRMQCLVAEAGVHVGMWYTILQFINIIGVVTNACLIAFTSAWGNSYDIVGQLLIVIIFEVRLCYWCKQRFDLFKFKYQLSNQFALSQNKCTTNQTNCLYHFHAVYYGVDGVLLCLLQHIVFSVKFLIAAFIPDVPADIRLAIKRVHVTHLLTTTHTALSSLSHRQLLTTVQCY